MTNTEIENIINTEVSLISKELQEEYEKKRDDAIQATQRENEKPCSICGKKDFVQKFREVSGSTKGRFYGSYSLFGGSISGYIDGETHTSPVLSCRGCGNERHIEIPCFREDESIYESNFPFRNLSLSGEEASQWAKKYYAESHLEFCRKSWFEMKKLKSYYGDELSKSDFVHVGIKELAPKKGFFASLFG